MYEYLEYENKLAYTKIIFGLRDFLYETIKPTNVNKEEIDQSLIKLSAIFECITMGYYLHNHLESILKEL